MTAYTTVDEVRLALAPIIGDPPESDDTSDEPDTASVLSDDQITDAIEQASSRIDTFLAQRYQTPVAPLDPAADPLVYPSPVGWWARDLAAFLCSLTFFRSSQMQTTEPIYVRQAMVVADMTAVRDGKQALNLPPATDGPAADTGRAGVVNVGFAGVFDLEDTGYPAPPLPHGGWYSGFGF